jgi:capsular polysaccharide biosynthesis protein
VYDKANHASFRASPASEAANEEFFTLADLARAVRRRLWMVVLVPLLAAGAAVAISLLQPPTYEATATVVVGPSEAGASQQEQENLSSRIAGLQVLAHEMAVMGLNRSMVDEVVADQGDPGKISASELRENLTVAQVEDTRFLSLAYTERYPERAQAVANAAAKVFAKRAPEASGMATDATVEVNAYAPPPVALEGPNPLRNGLVAAVLGLMIGIGLAFLSERFEAKGRLA